MSDHQVTGTKGTSRKKAPVKQAVRSSKSTVANDKMRVINVFDFHPYPERIMLKKSGYLKIADFVESGIKVAVVDWLAEKVAPHDNQFAHKLVASATLARRRQQAKENPKKAVLSIEESARAVRVARVFDRALSVWKDEDAAREFLNRPHMLLDNRTPLDVTIKTDEGARVVEEVLGKLAHGTAL